ncbi:Di-sulfide bridge nucleocytoplasmic transport domain-containing protein [Dipodascopsis tothii]|uniref:Di-sulfide bridge nucleocytoplasmic transport domain-containing protein n=1 Tax=Dipodascopsis tothii TaxID=44089 RepID=UPI0034CD0882
MSYHRGHESPMDLDLRPDPSRLYDSPFRAGSPERRMPATSTPYVARTDGFAFMTPQTTLAPEPVSSFRSRFGANDAYAASPSVARLGQTYGAASPATPADYSMADSSTMDIDVVDLDPEPTRSPGPSPGGKLLQLMRSAASPLVKRRPEVVDVDDGNDSESPAPRRRRRASPRKKDTRTRRRRAPSIESAGPDDSFDVSVSADERPLAVAKRSDRSVRSVSGRSISDDGGSLASFMHAHQALPYIFGSYLQLAFNLFLVTVFLYLIVAFVTTIRNDVNQKVNEYIFEVLVEIDHCAKEYVANRCAPDQRVPAAEKSCLMWEKCMKRDASVIGRAKVSAETFAEIINSFVEHISYKTMLFCLLLVFGSLYVSSRAAPPAPAPAPPARQPSYSQALERAGTLVTADDAR